MTLIAHPVNTPQAWSERAALAVPSHEAAGWTVQGQLDRFQAVLRALAPQPGESLLDVGCGTGELSDLLPDDIDYCGFDTATGMIVRAQREHPDRRFQTWQPAHRFDVVACIGPFNLADRWSKQHTYHALRHMWDTTDCRALAASLYAGTDENCLAYTVDELAHAGRQMSWNVTAERWRHNDILLTVRR